MAKSVQDKFGEIETYLSELKEVNYKEARSLNELDYISRELSKEQISVLVDILKKELDKERSHRKYLERITSDLALGKVKSNKISTILPLVFSILSTILLSISILVDFDKSVSLGKTDVILLIPVTLTLIVTIILFYRNRND